MKRVLIVAGDPSGDLHAANMVRKLRDKRPDIEVDALGGRHLAAACDGLLLNLTNEAVVGFSEVVTHLPAVWEAYRTALAQARKSDLVVLVDYPGMNLALAKAIRKMTPRPRTLYYIAPQVWAWKKGRAKLMSEILDRVAVVFPFETRFYTNAEFVGHPLLDYPTPEPDPALFPPLPVRDQREVVALLPGSRKKEILRHIDLFAGVARLLKTRGFRPIVSVADSRLAAAYDAIDAERYSGGAGHLLASSDLAVVKSGTSTLEAALIGKPFAAVYRLSALTYALGKWLVKTDHIAMPNILLGKRVVPEFVQDEATPEKIVDGLLGLDREAVHEEFKRLRGILGGKGSAERVAEICVEMLE